MKQHLILCKAKAKDTGASSMTIKHPRNDDNHHFHLPEQRGKVFFEKEALSPTLKNSSWSCWKEYFLLN